MLKKAHLLWVSLLMALLAIAYTYPLIRHFNQAIVYTWLGGDTIPLRISGDHLQLYYWFWLLKDNFLGNSPFLSNPYEFHMVGEQLQQGMKFFPFSLLYLIFTPFGDIAAYNMLMLLGFILSGVCMYQLGLLYCQRRDAALVGAMIFSLLPYRVAQAAGAHLNGFVYFFYPLIFYFLEQCIRKKSLLHGFLCGVAILSLSFVEVHMIYHLFIVLGAFVPLRMLIEVRSDIRTKTGPANIRSLSMAGDSWQVWVLFLTGPVAIFFVHGAFVYHQGMALFSGLFFTAAAVYIPMAVFLCLLDVFLMSALLGLDRKTSFQICTLSYLPLFLLILYAISPWVRMPHFGIMLMAVSALGIVAVRIFLIFRVVAEGHSPKFFDVVRNWVQRLMPLFPTVLFGIMAVVYLFYKKQRYYTGSIAQGGRQLREVLLFSPQYADVFTRLTAFVERNIFLGYIPIFLFVVMMVYLVRSHRQHASHLSLSSRQISIAILFGLAAVLSYVLATGTAFRHLALYKLFFYHFPYFNYPRVPARMMVVTAMALAVVASMAIGILGRQVEQKWGRTGAYLLVALLVAGIAVEYHPFRPMGITRLKPIAVYDTIPKDIGEHALLEIPLWPGDSHQSSLYQYSVTNDRISRINGYSPVVSKKYIEEIFKPLESINEGMLDQSQIDLLRALRVKYIAVHDNRDVFTYKVSPDPPISTVNRLKTSPFLKFIRAADHVYLFELR